MEHSQTVNANILRFFTLSEPSKVSSYIPLISISLRQFLAVILDYKRDNLTSNIMYSNFLW